MGRPSNNRIGEQFITNEEYKIVIVEYNNTHDLWVEFQDEHKARIHTNYSACRKGNVKNPYHPSVYGVGYFGVGKYKSRDEYGVLTDEYSKWKEMLRRGFDEKYKLREPTYKDVIVDPKLYCFQDFAKWYEDNYYTVNNEKMQLDKDILVKGNKEYRFDRMIFVPERINTLFVKCDARRGDLPIGVYYNKEKNKYQASCRVCNRSTHIGYYNTPERAFLVYKEIKEAYIKQVADEYKGRIPDRLYDAMYAWKVEIND